MKLCYQSGEEYLYQPPAPPLPSAISPEHEIYSPPTTAHQSPSSSSVPQFNPGVFTFDLYDPAFFSQAYPSVTVMPQCSTPFTPMTPSTPFTPVTPGADVPDSPFDVYTSYYPEYDTSLHSTGAADELPGGPPCPTTDPHAHSMMYPPSSVNHSTSYDPSLSTVDASSQYSETPALPPFSQPSHFFPPEFSSCGEPTSSHFTDPGLPRYDHNSVMMPTYSTPDTYPPSGGINDPAHDLIMKGEDAYKRQDYEAVLQILCSHIFDKSHHEQLQHLWLAAVYARESAVKRKKLTAVDRYRLRKRNPFPTSIWEGEKTIYCLKKSARDELTSFFDRNNYPTPSEKKQLAVTCGLTYVQISNWFKNKRMRVKESSRNR